MAVDGCGAPLFGLSLTGLARAVQGLVLATPGSAPRQVADAMRAHPELIRGPQAPDTLLMQSLEGWYAKGGAEGLICAASSDGLAVSLKVEDGHPRALRPALGAFLGTLGLDGSIFGSTPLRNSRDELVGEVQAS